MHTHRKNPTPTPTVTSKTVLLICGTVCASTWRSGSAIVTAKPRMKLTIIISGRERDFVIAVPSFEPIGVIEVSAPRENRPMPTTTKIAPTRKLRNKSVSIGETLKHSSTTMTNIGRTESADSRTFSRIRLW